MFNVVEKNNDRLKSLNIIYFFLKSNDRFLKIMNEYSDAWCVTLDKNLEKLYIDVIFKEVKDINKEEFYQKFYFDKKFCVKNVLKKLPEVDLNFIKNKLHIENLDSLTQQESDKLNNGISLCLEFVS